MSTKSSLLFANTRHAALQAVVNQILMQSRSTHKCIVLYSYIIIMHSKAPSASEASSTVHKVAGKRTSTSNSNVINSNSALTALPGRYRSRSGMGFSETPCRSPTSFSSGVLPIAVIPRRFPAVLRLLAI